MPCWSHRVLAVALLAFTAVGCRGPTESIPGPMEGVWEGRVYQARPSCSSGNACSYVMILDVRDEGGTLSATNEFGQTYTGTRDAAGSVVLHAGKDGVLYSTMLGTISTDGKQFNGQSFSGVATSVPATGDLDNFYLTRRSRAP